MPHFLSSGDGALTVEFGDSIDPALSDRVVALDAALRQSPIPGVLETVPTYRSLMVIFDPCRIGRAALETALGSLLPGDVASGQARRRWMVPVFYNGEDLGDVAARAGLTEADLIDIHTGTDMRVYMIGFAPGFTYLGGLPERLHTSRRADPRPKTPPGTISIGGVQAAISPPLELPSGWHLLGQTPLRSYAPERENPFMFEPGDMIRFHAISGARYAELSRAADAGEQIVEPEVLVQ